MLTRLKYLCFIVLMLGVGAGVVSCTDSPVDDSIENPSNKPSDDSSDDTNDDVLVEEINQEKLLGVWDATLIEFLYENGYEESIAEEEPIAEKLGVWSLVEVTKEEIKPVGSEELYGYQITGKSINVKGEDFSVDVTVVSVNDKILVVSYIHPNGCNWQITYIKTTLNDDKEDGGEDDDDEESEPEVIKCNVSGRIEPFTTGTTIDLVDLASDNFYSTEIATNAGRYSFDSKEFTSPYVELKSKGYFIDMFDNRLSSVPVELRTIADLGASNTIHSNILTHIKSERVRHLMALGMEYSAANIMAQSELLQLFGIEGLVSSDLSQISITDGTDEAAALIATTALIMVENATSYQFDEYVRAIATFFGESGSLPDYIFDEIHQSKAKVFGQLDEVRDNIITRYAETLWEGVEVKELYHYVDWDGDRVAGNEMLKAGESVELDISHINVPTEGGTYTIRINSPIPLYLEPQMAGGDDEVLVPGAGVPGSSLGNGFYDIDNKDIVYDVSIEDNVLKLSVSNLCSYLDKSATIGLYDYVGNMVASVSLKQTGDHNIASMPLLGITGQQAFLSLMAKMTQGMVKYNRIEQYYGYNYVEGVYTGLVDKYVYAGSSDISAAWERLYEANSALQQLRDLDVKGLNVYDDYFNVFSAFIYSNLVYGWGDVPYMNSYEAVENAYYDGVWQTASEDILNDLVQKLQKSFDSLHEKRNESVNCANANDLFFVSKDVVRVLLANIYMYQGDYAAATPLLQQVVDNGFYTLDASTNFKPDTDDNIEFDVDYGSGTRATRSVDFKYSTEVIFAFLNDSDAGTRADVVIEFVAAGVMPYITLSDVYLSLAECYYMCGDAEYANSHYLQSVIDAKNLTITESDVLMRIKQAREQITFYSGTYFAFLKRTGLAKDVCCLEEYQLLFPIPTQELYSNSNMVQNPGY